MGTMAGSPRPAPTPATAGAASSASGGNGKRLAIIGIAAVFIAAVAGVAIVVSGALSPHNGATATPDIAQATSTPQPTRTRRPARTAVPAATNEATAIPTAEPEPTDVPTAEPTATPKPTVKPSPTPAAASTAPPPESFVCDSDSTIPDPLSSGWNLRRLDWKGMGSYDRLTVTLDRYEGLGGNGTQAIVHVMPVADVSSTLNVSSPQAGTTAVALGLFQDVRLTWSRDQALRLKALKWITMQKDDNGYPWVVLGVVGDACYSLQVPDWTADDPQPATTVLVTVDVQH